MLFSETKMKVIILKQVKEYEIYYLRIYHLRFMGLQNNA